MASPIVETQIKAALLIVLSLTLFLGLSWYMWKRWREDVKSAKLMERLLHVTTSEAFEFGTWDHVRRVASIQHALELGNVARAEVALKLLESDLAVAGKGMQS